MVYFRSKSYGLRSRKAHGVSSSPKPIGLRTKNQCVSLSLKAGGDSRPSLRQAGKRSSPLSRWDQRFCLFGSSAVWMRATHIREQFLLYAYTSSDVSVLPKHPHSHTQKNVWPHVRAPRGLVILTHKTDRYNTVVWGVDYRIKTFNHAPPHIPTFWFPVIPTDRTEEIMFVPPSSAYRSRQRRAGMKLRDRNKWLAPGRPDEWMILKTDWFYLHSPINMKSLLLETTVFTFLFPEINFSFLFLNKLCVYKHSSSKSQC